MRMGLNMERLLSLLVGSLDISSLPHFLSLLFKVGVPSLKLLTSSHTLAVYDNLGIAWATSLLGFISIALLPIPWILFIWGPKIRQKSAYTITEH
jgi:hypothetical protein